MAYALNGRQTGREPDCDFYVAMNSWCGALPFCIPGSPTGRQWRRVVDTALASPLDIVEHEQGPPVEAGSIYLVAPYSLIVLISVP